MKTLEKASCALRRTLQQFLSRMSNGVHPMVWVSGRSLCCMVFDSIMRKRGVQCYWTISHAGNVRAKSPSRAACCIPAVQKWVKDLVKDSGLKVNHPRFTCSRLNRKNRMSHPLLASKAVSGKVLSFWLAEACSARAARPQATQDDALVATTICHYASMLKRMELGSIVLSAEEAENIYKDGMIHLRTCAMLRRISASRKRGRMPLRSMFTLLPKHHHLKHALQDARATRVSPNAYNLWLRNLLWGHRQDIPDAKLNLTSLS